MKEKIYTIPVTNAFKKECECPLCILEKELENQYIEYFLGPSLMEPDGRQETNANGFCKRHWQLLYKKQENRLGLGLIIDTHLREQNSKLQEIYQKKSMHLKKDSETALFKGITNKIRSKKTETENLVDDLISYVSSLETKCCICSKLNYTMDRYVDVILYLWFKEEEFKSLFNSKKGFCLKHFKLLLEGTKKYLNPKQIVLFLPSLMDMQMENMRRIQEEINWFTLKFDYRYDKEPWGNSRDAAPRSIQKITGFCDFE